SRDSIAAALEQLYSTDFQVSLRQITSPYGEGGASAAIISTIKTVSLDGLLKKRFYDASNSCA
ncbi:MAG: UDP-N-acetylglucosamine 2-epimerase, partial [Candidatus Magasanikbacteria bacterium GW2011_GWC2_45_8]